MINRTFSPEKPCEIVQTKKRKITYYQPEKGIWLVLEVNNPIIKRDKGKEELYQETEIDNTLISSVLKYSYQYFHVRKNTKRKFKKTTKFLSSLFIK